MGLYIFRYCVDVTKEELTHLDSFDIDKGLREARLNNNASHVFGTIGHGASVTGNVFIVRANNYKDCMNFIRMQKEIIESSAWQRGTFGGHGICTGEERFDTAKNKTHMFKCISPGGRTDVVICYKVPEEYAKFWLFFDAVGWAESCRHAVTRDYKLPDFNRFRVYE